MSTHPVRILLANVFADEYYRTALHSRLGAGPRQYLLGRGVTPEILDDPGWSIGYAPTARTGLVDQLRALPWPYADDELLDTGLVARTRSGELVDRFRDRVMFGIRPARRSQLVLGFTGRKSPRSVDWTPKYLGSPNGLVYDKSRHLFGLAEQRTLLQHGALPLLVEGPLDVLAVAGLGLDVAPVSACGTALSVWQAKELKPYLRRGALVAYDGDDAGSRAALNAYERLATYTADLRGVQLPTGEDPASLAVRDPLAMRRLVDQAPPLAEPLLRAAVAPFIHRLDNAEVRVSALHTATRLLARLHPADAASQVAWLSDRLGISPDEVTRDLTDAVSRGRASSTAARRRATVHSLTPRPDLGLAMRL